MANSWRSRALVRASAIVGSVGLTFAGAGLGTLVLFGAEAVARVVAPDYLLKTRGLHVFSEIYGWTPRKGTTASLDGRRISVNPSGYRGRELPLPKTGDGTRLVVLGDSIAFGLGVHDEETFSSLLDSRDNGFEVVNLAVQGYDPGQELLVLLQDGLRYAPDVVVLEFCVSNDYAEAMLPVSLYDGKKLKPRFRLVGNRLTLVPLPPLQFPSAARVWLSDYSHLFNRSAMLWRPAPPRAADWHTRYNEAMRDEDDALQLSLALVRAMSDVCRERGIAFLVATFPDRSSYRQKLANRRPLHFRIGDRRHRHARCLSPLPSPRSAHGRSRARWYRAPQPARTRHSERGARARDWFAGRMETPRGARWAEDRSGHRVVPAISVEHCSDHSLSRVGVG